MKTATKIIEEAVETFCKEYCRYTDESLRHLDSEGLKECDKCPLTRL